MVRVFASGQGDLGSIPGRVISSIQKQYLMPPCLTQHYKVLIKGNVVNQGKGLVPSPTP